MTFPFGSRANRFLEGMREAGWLLHLFEVESPSRRWEAFFYRDTPRGREQTRECLGETPLEAMQSAAEALRPNALP